MRTFVAVFPPESVTQALAGALDGLRKPADGVSWVRPANLHYTLRFLGEIEPSRAEAAQRAARASVAGISPFQVRLGAPGVFPNSRSPRVLWLGAAEGAEALRVLAGSLEEALRREGFGRADRPFEPHLTLGRVREPRSAGELAARFAAAAFPDVVFEVTAVIVVHSTLDPRGSRYAALGSYSLTAPGKRPDAGA